MLLPFGNLDSSVEANYGLNMKKTAPTMNANATT
jgi:hypothetical protein